VKLLGLASLLAIGLALGVPGIAAADIKKGDHFVELDAKTAAGKKFRLKDMAGKWVLFTFGASWCEPCHKELPAWDKIAPKLNGKVLFVAVNINNKMEDGKKFIDSLKLQHIFPVYMPDENSPAMKAYDPEHMPSTFVIDPKGVVQIVQFGFTPGDEDKLAATLAELTK
jgi:thiol-disulfide isomerase/thioredoxin